MRRFKLSALVAILCLTVTMVAVTAAQATEGPFYKIEEGRLAATNTAPITAKSAAGAGGFTLKNATTGTNIHCEQFKLQAGAHLLGSNGANGSESVEVIVFEECTVTGNGTPCEVENKTITTRTVENFLDYSNTERVKIILVDFEPVTQPFVIVKFVGAGCKFKTTAIEGTVGGEAQSEAGSPVKVGEEPAKAKVGKIFFPSTTIKVDWFEVAGALKEVKIGLKAFGTMSTLEGTAEIEQGGNNWCIATGAAGSKC
jgi:hypothetical protein